jgi:hypothetical protein
VGSLVKLNATLTSRLPAGTPWLTAKRYKVFPIRVTYRSIKTIKSTYLHKTVLAGSREVTVAYNFISERTVVESSDLSFALYYFLKKIYHLSCCMSWLQKDRVCLSRCSEALCRSVLLSISFHFSPFFLFCNYKNKLNSGLVFGLPCRCWCVLPPVICVLMRYSSVKRDMWLAKGDKWLQVGASCFSTFFPSSNNCSVRSRIWPVFHSACSFYTSNS